MADKRYSLGFLVTVFGLLVTGCATRLGAFTVISTKNIDWSRAAEYTRNNQRIEGEDKYHVIVFIPTKFKITIEDAVDKALQNVPGAVALVDAVLRSKIFWIPYIYGQRCYLIEGTVLIDTKFALAGEDHTNYFVFYTDNGNDFEKISVSEAEYLCFVK
jgi:hypothetical protein